MKYLITILFILAAVAVEAQVKIGADGLMHPTGLYPAVSMHETRGFSLSVQTIVQRNAIPANYRELNMNVLVMDSSAIYTLVGGLLDANWIKALSTTQLTSNSVYIDTTLSLTGLTLQVVIPHGMTGTPHVDYVEVEDSEGVSIIPAYADGANVYVDYEVAPICDPCTYHFKLTP